MTRNWGARIFFVVFTGVVCPGGGGCGALVGVLTVYEEAIAANRANWDERADVHARSRMYDVEGFLADPAEISTVVLNDLSVLAPYLPNAGVSGRSLLHLQCHIGTDTISWARLGAGCRSRRSRWIR